MTPQTSVSSSGWLRAAPVVVLLGAGLILTLSWGALPDRWIVHWGLNGPDGWADRTVSQVFAPLLFGLVVCLFLEGVATGLVLVPGRMDPRLSPRGAAAVGRLTGDLVRTINVALALMFGVLAVGLPLLQPLGPALVVMAALCLVLGGTGIGVVRMALAFKAAVASGELEAIPGYNGIIYRNPNDPRLMVPKLTGMGSTLNFAHPWALPTLGLFLLGPLLGVVLLLATL